MSDMGGQSSNNLLFQEKCEFFLSSLCSAYHVSCLQDNNPLILVAGNGGSASQADHLVGELVGRFDGDCTPVAAISLTSNTAVLTALANDFGYDHALQKQVMAYGKPNGIFIGLSTSGESMNVYKALMSAKVTNRMKTFAITGNSESPIAREADYSIELAGSAPRVQEFTLWLIHQIAGRLKKDVVVHRERKQ